MRHIGGEHVTVTTLMGPGIDPHQYKASAGDVDRLGRADLIVYNGIHLEAKMADVLERLGRRQPTLAAGEAVPEDQLITNDGDHDPHVWFDVSPLEAGPRRAWSARSHRSDPANAADYQANADAYLAELTALHTYVGEQAARVPGPQRILITAHDAFNYLGRAYGLEVVGLQGISTLSEAGTADVQDLAEFIAERKIPAIFVETSVSPRAIEAVREAVRAKGFEVAIGGEIYSDAMGDEGTPEGTYLGMVRHNIDTIVAALGGEVEMNDTDTTASTATVSAVEVTDLTVAYRERPVLWDIDLSVPQGKLMAILGPNGAGKTTLIKAILGLMRTGRGPRGDPRRPVPRPAPPGGLRAPARQRRLGLPHHRARRGDDGPLRRPGLAPASRPPRARPGPRRPRQGGHGGLRPVARSRSSRAASSSACSWPAPWCRTPRSTSWTSPSRVWTPAPNAPSSIS